MEMLPSEPSVINFDGIAPACSTLSTSCPRCTYSDALIRRRTRRLRAPSLYNMFSPPPPVSLYAYAAAWSRCELCVSHRREPLYTLHTQRTNKKIHVQAQPSSSSTTSWLYTRLRLSFFLSLEREREKSSEACDHCLSWSVIIDQHRLSRFNQPCGSKLLRGPDWFFSSPSLYDVFRFPFFVFQYAEVFQQFFFFFLPVMADGRTADEITRPDWNSKKQKKKRKVIFLHHRWSVMTEQENLKPKNQNVGPSRHFVMFSSRLFFFWCAAKTLAGQALRWAPHVGQHGDSSSSLLCPRPNSFT